MASTNPYNINWLLGDTNDSEFFNHYWEKKPQYFHGTIKKDLESFLNLNDFKQLLKSNRINPKQLSVFTNQALEKDIRKYYLSNNCLNTYNIYKDFKQHKSTICFRNPELINANIKLLTQSLSRIFYSEVTTALFHSPKDSIGLDVHFDYYNAMILQVTGRKRWRLYDFVVDKPCKESDRIKLHHEKLGRPIIDVTLEPGDVLYVPRGMPHKPECEDSDSLHLTVGITTHTWANTFDRVIEKLRNDNVLLRESLPTINAINENPFQFESKLKEVMNLINQEIDINLISSINAEQYYLEQDSVIDSELLELMSRETLTIDTQLEHNANLEPFVVNYPKYSEIVFAGTKIKIPNSLVEAANFIVNNRTFLLGEISSSMSDEIKITLIKKLVSNGCLKIVKTPEINDEIKSSSKHMTIKKLLNV
ncbi:MAG: hypothetical protein HWE27_16155 [Gammaproteobacteria bacterium]|nr:hypothetical protein [Gammaproteobacteria bacterium]